LLGLLVGSLVFTACSFSPLKSKKTTPPYIDKNGQVDQASFEASQKVSNDENLDVIEKEIDNTIILDEDFSDLE